MVPLYPEMLHLFSWPSPAISGMFFGPADLASSLSQSFSHQLLHLLIRISNIITYNYDILRSLSIMSDKKQQPGGKPIPVATGQLESAVGTPVAGRSSPQRGPV